MCRNLGIVLVNDCMCITYDHWMISLNDIMYDHEDDSFHQKCGKMWSPDRFCAGHIYIYCMPPGPTTRPPENEREKISPLCCLPYLCVLLSFQLKVKVYTAFCCHFGHGAQLGTLLKLTTRLDRSVCAVFFLGNRNIRAPMNAK